MYAAALAFTSVEGRRGCGPRGGQWQHAVPREQERQLRISHHRIKDDFQTFASHLAMPTEAIENPLVSAAPTDSQ
jgi:two-component sensor histidine kinase